MRALFAGSLFMPVEALIDSYSILGDLAAAHLKLPVEKSTYAHLAYVRGKPLQHGVHAYCEPVATIANG